MVVVYIDEVRGKWKTFACYSFSCTLMCMIIFTPLYVQEENYKNDYYTTKCNVLSSEKINCSYITCQNFNKNKECNRVYSHIYNNTFEIVQTNKIICDTSIFYKASSCKSTYKKKYEVGSSEKCYMKKNCKNISFNKCKTYTYIKWIIIAIAILFFILGFYFTYKYKKSNNLSHL